MFSVAGFNEAEDNAVANTVAMTASVMTVERKRTKHIQTSTTRTQTNQGGWHMFIGIDRKRRWRWNDGMIPQAPSSFSFFSYRSVPLGFLYFPMLSYLVFSCLSFVLRTSNVSKVRLEPVSGSIPRRFIQRVYARLYPICKSSRSLICPNMLKYGSG